MTPPLTPTPPAPAPRRALLLAALTALAVVTFLTGRAAAAPLPTVTVALDWVPNVNHIGLYVAQDRGWYAQAGVAVTLLPYASTSPDTLVATGRADLGVSSAEGVCAAAAAGQPVVSVAAVFATNTAGLAVLASSGITRPRQLDGRTYAAFGAPYETPIVRRVITADGGRGTYRSPVLSTFGLSALLGGKADFMWVYEGVEGVQAAREGHPLRVFSMARYGVPDAYTPVLTARPAALTRDRAKLRAFMAATARGYDYARTHPTEAADAMLRRVPAGTIPDAAVLRGGVAFLNARRAFTAPGRPWGEQTLKMWTDYPAFLLRAGAVLRPDGTPATTLTYSALFSNALLPGH